MIRFASYAEPISDTDLKKMYTSSHFDTDIPTGLYNKVQFDIRFYFCQRGDENMSSMTKSSFIMNIDPDTGKRYVTKTDELSKNHRGNDTEVDSWCMPETSTKDCPVTSFEKYLSKLHPEQNRFWCYPRDSFYTEDEVWYTRKPVGINTLCRFLPDLSRHCKLSQTYTNHSIRATTASVLHQEHFHPKEIESMTRHK